MQVLLLIKKASWETRFYNLVFREWGDRIRIRDLVLQKHTQEQVYN